MGIPGASFNGRNDLVIDGKKFSGNAQYLYNGFTLHHGSLLFDTNIEQMVKSTTVDPGKIISKGIKSVRERVTNISEHLSAPMDSQEFKMRMVTSIMGGSDYKTYELTETDRRRIFALADLKFNNWDCIYGRNPQCSLTKTKRFAGGKVEVSLEVCHGCIKDCAIHGDFFGSLDLDALCQALIGTRYEEGAIAASIAPFDIEHGLYQITRGELLSCII